MNKTNLTSSLMATIITVAFVLPYAAPAICSALDRPGFGMTMAAPDDMSHLKPSSPDMCCSLDRCGTPQVAPLAFQLPEVTIIPEQRLDFIRRPRSPITRLETPPTPPPEA